MTGGIFAILDDIALLLDDAATMSKVAAKKTVGLLGDDLAVNAEKATGFKASRELPVLWAITKGSFLNKLIILPVAFILSSYLHWLIVPILLVGGMYLSYEGVEKIYHLLAHSKKEEEPVVKQNVDKKELLQAEKKKIQSAIRTDFILSIEIIMMALGTVMNEVLTLQIIVVSVIAILATIGVYGIVALIVRMDDAGFFLIEKAAGLPKTLAAVVKQAGAFLVASLPHVIRGLAIIGTIAMLLVGGGMFTHNVEQIHHALHVLPNLLGDLVVGLAVGTVILGLDLLYHRIRH